MKDVHLKISKALVYHEVKKLTSYQASKLLEKDPTTYDRLLATDASRELLERYWREAVGALEGALREALKKTPPLSVSRAVELGEDLELTLTLSSRFDESLLPAIEAGLFSYLSASILSSWYRLSFPEGSATATEEATAHLSALLKKLHYKRPPVPPTRP